MVDFKGPSVDTELSCKESPCQFDVSQIGDLQLKSDYEVLVKPVWKQDFVVPFPLLPGSSTYQFLPDCDDAKNEELAKEFSTAGNDDSTWVKLTNLLENADCTYDFTHESFESYGNG